MLKRKWLLGFIGQIQMTKPANPNEFGRFKPISILLKTYGVCTAFKDSLR
jgi:hypothetical protein